jgi:hypothetical protein
VERARTEEREVLDVVTAVLPGSPAP